jgi:hypothetical protein
VQCFDARSKRLRAERNVVNDTINKKRWRGAHSAFLAAFNVFADALKMNLVG